MIDGKGFYLANVQADNDDAETLTASDYIHVIAEGSAVESVPVMEKIDAASHIFDNEIQTLSSTNTNIKINQYMYGLGNSATPYFVKMLRGCGYELETTEVSTGHNRFDLTPAQVSSKLTIHQYEVNGITDAILTQAYNAILSPKFTFDGTKVPRVEMSGVGCYGGESRVLYNALPSITKANVNIPSSCGALCNYMGLNYKLAKFDFDPGVTAEQFIDWTEAEGFGTSELTGREGKVTATIYADPSQTLPLTALRTGTTAAFSFVWGPTGHKIRFAFTYLQIVSVKRSTIGRFRAFDIEAIVLNNTHTITANYDIE